MANSRKTIRKLVQDGFIIKKPARMHSRARVRDRVEAKRKGRHSGFGKRKGTREARMPQVCFTFILVTFARKCSGFDVFEYSDVCWLNIATKRRLTSICTTSCT